MRSIADIKSDQAPVVFLGSCTSMYNIIESCDASGRKIVGIYDPDYSGELYGLPILGADVLEFQKEFEFFVATGWNPGEHPVTVRNNQKRNQFINLMHQHNLAGATLIHPTCVISPQAQIGRNVRIGAMSMITAGACIANDVNIKEQCYISHGVQIGRDSIVQLKATITGDVHVGEHVWVGVNSTIIHRGSTGNAMRIGDRVLIHPSVTVMQSLPSDAVASLRDRKFSRVF